MQETITFIRHWLKKDENICIYVIKSIVYDTNYNEYQKRKEKGITPEAKAARAKYMREYRLKKKMETLSTINS